MWRKERCGSDRRGVDGAATNQEPLDVPEEAEYQPYCELISEQQVLSGVLQTCAQKRRHREGLYATLESPGLLSVKRTSPYIN